MAIDRRQLLKIAGLSTLAGIAGLTSSSLLKDSILEASQYLKDPKELKANRWAFVINMSAFKTSEDIKRVTDACHQKHNVPEIDNPRHEIKWIWTDRYQHVFPGMEHQFMGRDFMQMPFLVLCNHCDNPPCVRVCPTKATFKRKNGIVMMDMHRCIGCRFCMAACPYGARSFNWVDPRPYIKKQNPTFPTRMKGVVEKCTLCYERLAEGLNPICVEESKGAIAFGDLSDPNSEVRRLIATNFTIRRKPELGTMPHVFYIIGGKDNA